MMYFIYGTHLLSVRFRMCHFLLGIPAALIERLFDMPGQD